MKARVTSALIAAVLFATILAIPEHARAHHQEVCTKKSTAVGVQIVCRTIEHGSNERGNNETESDDDGGEEFTIDDVSFVAEFVGGVNPLSDRGRGSRIGAIGCPAELTPGGGSVTRSVTQGRTLTFDEVMAYGLDPTDTFARFNVLCYDLNTVENRVVVVRIVDGPSLRVLFEGALASAVAQAGAPQIATSPPDRGVVNFPTWFWVENWVPVTGSDSAGSVSIVVTGQPVGSTITTGNDDDAETLTCDGPGQQWDPDAGIDPMAESNCSYTYPYPSAWDDSGVFEVVATTTWTFSWSLNGIGQGTITTLPRTNQRNLNVVEIQTVGVAGN